MGVMVPTARERSPALDLVIYDIWVRGWVYIWLLRQGGSPALDLVKSKQRLILIFMNVDIDARLSNVAPKPCNIFSLIACCISAWVDRMCVLIGSSLEQG